MEILGGKKPEIEYPCEWKYKVIGEELKSILGTIDDLLIDKFEYELSPSNISKKGKYYSLNLQVKVESETERDFIYNSLLDNSKIKIVL